MNNVALVDTNILIYAKDVSSTYHKESAKFLNGKEKLYTTSKNLIEYYAVVTKGNEPLLSPKEALTDVEESS